MEYKSYKKKLSSISSIDPPPPAARSAARKTEGLKAVIRENNLKVS